MTLSPDRVLPSSVLLEACENYQKQSYRNRCYILGPQGVQMLQVPVVHGASWAIRDVLVDYSTPWVVRTQRALDTAYETSAFYEYYRDGLFGVLDSRPSALWDLNLSLIRWCLDRLHLACKLIPTTSYSVPAALASAPSASVASPAASAISAPVVLAVPSAPAPSSPPADDYRYVIHPKRPDTVLQDLGLARPYYQVFRDRMGGFTPGLSVLDLLFNEGPDSLIWLVSET